jgi:hypothetical protein
MNRSIRIGTPILLIVLGAILYFAVEVDVSGIELSMVGLILGIAGLVWLIAELIMGASRTKTHHREVQSTQPNGDRVVESESQL